MAIDWKTPLLNLQNAVVAHAGIDNEASAIESTLSSLGTMYDARLLWISQQPVSPDPFAIWQSQYSATFSECNRIIRFSGGAAVAFDTSAPTFAIIVTRMQTAITALASKADVQVDASFVLASLQALYASIPSISTPVAYSVDTALLSAAITRANAYAAFLGFQ